MTFITQKLVQLKKKKQEITQNEKVINNNSDNPYQTDKMKAEIDKEINDSKLQDIQQKEQDRQLKQQLMAECRYKVIKICNTMRKLFPTTIKNKLDISALLNKSKSYFMVLEAFQHQGVSYETIKNLKDNITQVKNNLEYFIENPDIVNKDSVARIIEGMITELERLEIKILGVIYGIRY